MRDRDEKAERSNDERRVAFPISVTAVTLELYSGSTKARVFVPIPVSLNTTPKDADFQVNV
jgi:hypothetical protein